MGSTIGNIGSFLGDAARNGSNMGGKAAGQILGNGQDSKNIQNAIQWGGDTVGGIFSNPAGGPKAPEGPQGLSALKQQQLTNANDFQKNMPQMQAKMNQQLSDQSNQQMQAQLKQNKQNNSNRGLLYGGVEQGGQQGIRANAQAGLAHSISNSNADLQNASQTLNAQALQTGAGIQQNQQMIQNQIYTQQLATMQANNSMTGSAAGMGLLYLMM